MLWPILLSVLASTQALDNGLGLTPPMGWLTWERFRCIIDCQKYPNECISEQLIKRTSDLLVSEGYLDAGYNYIGIDDCWMEKDRGPDGRLVPDRERFPSGMKALGDYVHDKGLQFGIYEDYGNLTCQGYPGVLGYEQLDIDTIVGWGADYIKLDGCYVDNSDMDEGYPAFGAMLNASGRPVLYSCSWPAYQEHYYKKNPIVPDYESIAKHCNLWRNYGDIDDNWNSLISIINWFGDNQERFAKYAGPGHWNDPDMLLIGNFGLSLDQARVQMAIWAVMAAPLLMSTDLALMRPEFKEILLNRDVIAVNQDPLGRQGLRVLQQKYSQNKISHDVWTRELSDGSYAIAFVNQRLTDGSPYAVDFTHDQMKIPNQDYDVVDLYHLEQNRELKADEKFETRINPTGVKFYKFTPKSSSGEASDQREDSMDTLQDRIINDLSE